MRKDHAGNLCPATLGEYQAYCLALTGPECEAVKFLQAKIDQAPRGAEEPVLADDLQMRNLLFPMVLSWAKAELAKE